MSELADLLELLRVPLFPTVGGEPFVMAGRELRDEVRLLEAFHRAFDRGVTAAFRR